MKLRATQELNYKLWYLYIWSEISWRWSEKVFKNYKTDEIGQFCPIDGYLNFHQNITRSNTKIYQFVGRVFPFDDHFKF